MGMPAVSMPYWTAAMVRELPDDGKRYECIDGELLVTPSPGTLHQWIVAQLLRRVAAYVEDAALGAALPAPLDVELDDGMIVQPDVLAFRLTSGISAQRIPGLDLLLVIEVLSPGTASRDRGIKRAFYQRIGVGEYWIVHPASRLVERWRNGATAPVWEDSTLTWQPEGAAQALVVDLPALFDAVPEQFRTP